MRSSPNLSRKMMLEAPTDAPDGSGGVNRIWAALGELWVELRSSTGRLTEVGNIPIAQSRARIILRASAPGAPSRPEAGQRFRDGSSVFLIDAVTDLDASSRYLVCFVREERAQ